MDTPTHEPLQSSAPTGRLRTRWAAIGAAVAVTLGAGGLASVDAAKNSGSRDVYTAISGCRVADTRPDEAIGGRATPLGAAETHPIKVTGDNGECTDIPADVTAVALNVTAVLATETTHLTIWPEGPVPNSASLNPSPGQPPAPNAVTTKVSGTGTFNIFNFSGSVHVIVDIVGFYQDHRHDDLYYTKAQTDAAIESATPTLPAPVQDIVDFDPDYTESGGSTTKSISIESATPTVVNTAEITLPNSCPGIDSYDVIVTASGHTHYAGSDGTDAEMTLRLNGTKEHRATLEVQLQPSASLSPEIPYSRTMMFTVDAGTHTFEWTAEKEYSSSDTFRVRNPILVVQPVAHRCE